MTLTVEPQIVCPYCKTVVKGPPSKEWDMSAPKHGKGPALHVRQWRCCNYNCLRSFRTATKIEV